MRPMISRAAVAAVLIGLCAGGALAQNVRYVRSDAAPGGNGQTWATAFQHVQQAVFSTPPGGAVWVARGTYRPATSTIQLAPNVSLFGGFVGTETSLDQRDPAANPTILSGDTLGDDDIGGSTGDNVTVLSAPPNVLANTIVDGFTIRNGRGTQGGGLRCMGSPLIRNCHFTRNNTELSSSSGAAVYLGSNGTPRIVNCRFSRNGNTFSTFGVLLVEGPGVDARIIGCNFTGNSCSSQGIISVRSAAGATLVNCVVVGNTLRGADGAVFYGGTGPNAFNLINCTIAGNTSNDGPTAGLRIASVGTPVLIRNCVLWGNVAPGVPAERAQFLFPSPSAARLDSCRVQGWTGQFLGTGTSAADPMLVDLDGPDDLPGTGDEDARLLPGSSCIDAANNFYVWPDIADVDGDADFDEPTPTDATPGPRFLDDPDVADTGVGKAPIADIGAYESAGAVEPCSADFNNDGVTNSQDFFDFLAVFFNGCP